MKKGLFITSPYILWMIIFIVAPLLLVLYYSFMAETAGFGSPLAFSLENYRLSFDQMYLRIILRSINFALVCTAICFVIGYPAAYIIASKNFSNKNTIFFLLIVPMWMNFLLRTYGWVNILEPNGILNNILRFIGLGRFAQGSILFTERAVILGMVYNFLPFMILPIYTVLAKIDESLVEAAQDLGANSGNVFMRVIFPLSIPGVISGITMVFIPSVTTFIIPSILGGGMILIGNLIEREILIKNNWNFASALSIILMTIILITMGIFQLVDKDGTESGGRLL